MSISEYYSSTTEDKFEKGQVYIRKYLKRSRIFIYEIATVSA